MPIDFTSMDERLKNRKRSSIFDPTPNLDLQVIGEKDERKLPEYVKPEMWQEVKTDNLKQGLEPVEVKNPYKAARRVFGLPFYELEKSVEGEIQAPPLAPYRRSVVNTGSTIAQGTEIPDTAVERAIAMSKEELDAWKPKSGVGQWWKRIQEKNVELWEQEQFMQIYEDVEDYQAKIKEGQRLSNIADKAKDLPEDYVEPGIWGTLVKGEGSQQFFNGLMTITARGLEKITKDRGFLTLEQATENLTDYFRTRSAEHPEWGQPAEWAEMELKDKLGDPRFYIRTLQEGLPSTLINFGSAIIAGLATKDPQAGLAAGFLTSKYLEGGFAYEEAISNGASPQSADDYSSLVGTINGALELLPLGRLLSKMPGGIAAKRVLINRVAKEIMLQGATEFTTEGMQEAVGIALEKMYNENAEFWTDENWARISEAATQGGIVGGFVGGGTQITPNIYTGIKQKSKEALDSDLAQQLSENQEGFAKIPGAPVQETTPLEEEAKKFDTEEEFIDSLNKTNSEKQPGEAMPSLKDPADGVFYFHGVNKKDVPTLLEQGFKPELSVRGAEGVEQPEAFFVGDKVEGGMYGDSMVIVTKKKGVDVKTIGSNELLQILFKQGGTSFKRGIDEINFGREQGYDAINVGDEIIILSPEKFDILSIEDIFNKAKKPKVKKLKIKQQISNREQALLAREDAKLKKELLIFPESRFEQQYQDFKKLKSKESEDVEQLRKKNKDIDPATFDNIFYDQEQTMDDVLTVFQDRFTEERKPLPKVPKETKGIVAETVRTKERFKSSEVRNKILRDIKNKTAKAEFVKREVIFYANKFLDNESKGKLLATVKNAKNFKDLEKARDMILRLEERDIKRNLLSTIKKELKYTKPVKAGQKRVGKYDYESNKFFDTLREYNKLNQDEAQAKLDKIPEEGLTNMERINARFLSLKSNGVESSISLYDQVLADIREMKEAGRDAKDDADFIKQVERKERVEKVSNEIERIKGDKDSLITKMENVYRKGFTNIYSMINSIAGKEIAEQYDPQLKEDQRDTAIFEATQKISKKSVKILEVKNRNALTKTLHDMAKKDFEIVDTDGLKTEISKLELIDIYNSIKNDLVKERYYNAFGQEQVNSLLTNLTPKEIELADMMQEEVQKYREILNQRNIEITGRDMGTVDNYWPASSEHKSDFYDDIKMQGETPSAMKARANNSNIIPIPTNSWLKMFKHINQAEHVKHLSREFETLKRIFADRKIKNQIENKFGTGENNVYNSLIQHIEYLSLNKTMEKVDAVAGMYGKALNNWVLAKIALSPTVFARQLGSQINFMEDMNPGEWTKYYFEGLSNPKKTFNFMWDNAPFLEARFNRGHSEALKDAIKGGSDISANMGSYTKGLSAMVRSGDITAIIFGGYPVIKAEMAKGKSMQEAVDIFETRTLRAQQAGLTSSLSHFQNSSNPFAKTLLRFKNTLNQYARKQMDAIINFRNKDISASQLVKTTVIYSVINPMLYVTLGWGVTEGFKALFGNYDDDDKDLLGDLMLQVAINPFLAIPIIDGIAEFIARKIAGKKTYGVFSHPLLGEIEIAIKKLGKNDVGLKDLLEALSALQEPFKALPTQTFLRYYKYATDGKTKTLKLNGGSSRPGGINRLKINRPKIQRLKIKRTKINRLKIRR